MRFTTADTLPCFRSVSVTRGELIESRSRFALVRRDDGLSDVVFYPVLESSPLERYDEAQQKQLLAGKAILADVETADGRHSKAFVQIDEETKQVMYIPRRLSGATCKCWPT